MVGDHLEAESVMVWLEFKLSFSKQVHNCCLLVWLHLDVASAEQESTAGPRGQDEDDKEEDLSMETEDQEVDLQAAEVQELKPEQLDSSKASQTGVKFSSSPARFFFSFQQFLNFSDVKHLLTSVVVLQV